MKWTWDSLKTRTRPNNAKSQPAGFEKDIYSKGDHRNNGRFVTLLSRLLRNADQASPNAGQCVQLESDRLCFAYTSFLGSCPEYVHTVELEDLRRKEFERLDSEGHVYLDYTG